MISEQWATSLAARLRPALEAAMVAVVAGRPADDIAGIGIVTDPDAVGVEALANTTTNEAASVSRSPRTPIDERWNVGNWDLAAAGSDPLDDVRKELEAVGASLEPGGYGELRGIVWTSIASALAASAEEGFFDQWSGAIRVFQPLDSSAGHHNLYRWNAAINPTSADPDLRYFFQVGDPSDHPLPHLSTDADRSPSLEVLLAALGHPVTSPEFRLVAGPFADELVQETYDDGDTYLSAEADGIAFLFREGTARAIFLFAQPEHNTRPYAGFDALLDGVSGAPIPEEAHRVFGAPLVASQASHLFTVHDRYVTLDVTDGATTLVTLLHDNPLE